MRISGLLPEEQLQLRPLADDEEDLLARWIEHGRQERVFRSGPQITRQSLAAFQESLRAGSDGYECLVICVEDGAPAGYLDFRVKGQIGEVLGLYLEPRFRGRRFGPHLLRWTLAVLRERSCRCVEIEIYNDNIPSLLACRAAGFTRDEHRDKEEDGRNIYVMTRPIFPLEFLSPNNRFRYMISANGRLFHEDLYFHHLAIADAITEWLRHVQGVEVVLGLGSIAHRFADSWSDLDLGVLGRDSGLRQLRPGEQRLAGLSVDLFVVDLDTSLPKEWKVERRQAFEEAVVLYAANPELLASIHEAVRLAETERVERIGELLLELGWIGFQPRSWFGGTRYGYKWEVPYDLWLRRGSIESAHSTVHRALDLVLQLIFLANSRHVPDAKWRRYLVCELRWLPNDFEVLMRSIEACQPSPESFESRAQSLLDVIDPLVAYLESEGAIAKDLYTDYLQSMEY